MNLFDETLLNIILVLFPLLIYFCSCCSLIIKNKVVPNSLFILTLLTCLYLVFKYNNFIIDTKVLLLCNIPIVIAYLKKCNLLGILLSLIIIFCLIYYNSDLLLLVVIKYILYYVIYVVCTKKGINMDNFILNTAITQAFFLAFEINIYNSSVSFIKYVYIIFAIIIFYILTFMLVYLFSIVDKIINLAGEVKNFEREKSLKNSLFKLTHEIKNPIAVCKGYLDMIDVNDKVKTDKYLNIIREEINKSINIMSDFLEYSKIKINKECIDINLFLDDIYDEYNLLFKNNDIVFEYKSYDDEVYIMGDYNRLRQVFLNIIKNSIESIEGSGKVILGSYIKDNSIYIFVEDNGCGMDSEVLSRIKDMFYTTKRNGTGIGVNLSNEIIKSHSGQLNYESMVGVGTKATIILPLQNK